MKPFSTRRFRNRTEAGQLLAAKLEHYVDQSDVLVLGLPRGGVTVAYEVARHLHVPMDVLLVRKLGIPGCDELAMGAIASGGVRVINETLVQELQVPQQVIDEVAAVQEKELARREQVYRAQDAAIAISGKKVILVDDGIATGATLHAALEAVKRRQPARVIIAAPVASSSIYDDFRGEVDEIAVLELPVDFHAVGQVYQDFEPVEDVEVVRLMEKARTANAPSS